MEGEKTPVKLLVRLPVFTWDWRSPFKRGPEAGKLQKGDVLVAEATLPPWTTLFATAAAIVTDSGDILSHCAIVARDYRIPAVVGTGVATHMIHDGQMFEVDGNAGLVRMVEPA